MRGPEGHHLRGGFAWIHRPATAARAGIVIVPPFGYEAVCAQRSLRHLAEAAARAGILAIRLDLPGTGDSIGDDLEPDRVGAWIASILAARKLAVRGDDDTVPLDHVVFCGVRLGAILAAVAAAQLRGETLAPGDKQNVVGVVTIAAVASGRALVREGRALQATLDLAPAPPGLAPPDDVHEVVGFAQTAETRAKLGELDLLKLGLPAAEMLVIDRDDLPPNDKWVARLRELGAHVDHQRLPGYVEMVLDPHKTVVPQQIIDATTAFASRLGGKPVGPSGFRLAGSSFFAGAIRESHVDIDACVRGVETKPSKTGATPARGVILLNAGAVGHIGPNRLYVQLARMLAARGDMVLRVDLSGIGESNTRPGAVENTVYSEHALGDVAACVAWMRKQGVRTVAVAGLCSGAYHALKAAIAGQPIDTVVAINPLTFHYVPGMPLDFAAFRVTADAQRYAKSARSTESWKKLLRGDVDVRRVAKIVLARARQTAEHRGKDVLRRLRVPMRDDLGTDLLALARRGVAMRFIFSASDPGAAMLAEEGGSAVTRLLESGALSIRVIDGPDHTFTPRWSHPLLLDAIATATAP